MNTDLSSTGARPYVFSARAACVNCSPAFRVLHMINDAARADDDSWEEFDADSVPEYFTDGIRALRLHIDKLSDLTRPRLPEEDKNLWFMVEALIQARHLIDDMNASKQRAQGHSKS